MKLFLVYNARAGHRNAARRLHEVTSYLKKKNTDYTLAVTEYPGHAAELIRTLTSSTYDGIIAAGGDGTLFETVNGYFENPSLSAEKIPVGILPLGTGNAVARDLGLTKKEWKKSIDLFLSGNVKYIDTGFCTCSDKSFYFVNIVGLGFVAAVTKTAHLLKLFGNASYTMGVLWQTLKLPLQTVTLTVDGIKYVRENLFIEVSNTRYTSNFLMAPAARIDDGLLDITLANKLTRKRLIKILPKSYTGDHIHYREVETLTGKKIRIEASRNNILTPDGELTGTTPVTIECLKGALPVFWT